MNWYQTTLGDRFDYAARIMVILTAFAIPLSTAAMSITSGLLLIFWLLSGNFSLKFERIMQSQTALWVLGLFALLAVGLLYSSAEIDGAIDTFSKYKKLLIVPIIISLMLSERWRRYAIRSFMIGMMVLLAISYLKYFDVLPHGPVNQEYTAFKNRITHGIFMAFFFYLTVQFTISYPRWRWIFITVAILAIYNTVFMNNGRSGYIVLISLIILLFYQHVGWKGLLIAVITTPLLFSTAYYVSNDFQSRIDHSVSDVMAYTSGDYKNLHGISYRLEYYQTTLKVIKESPIYGFGTGSLATEYKKVADKEGLEPTDNLHNEFLMITSQLGVIGFAVFCLMLFFQWRASFKLDRENQLILQGLLVTMVVGCLFNSLLMDSGEGKFYVILLAIIFSIPGQQEKNKSSDESNIRT